MPNWVRTVREILPQTPAVLRSLRPTYHLASPVDLTEEFLRRMGIEGLLLDIDGTVMAHHALQVAPEFLAALGPHISGHGLPTAIVSNCDEERFAVLGQLFPEVPVVRAYSTSDGTVCRHLLRGVDTHSSAALTALFNDPRTRAARKPNPVLLRCALRVLGIADPTRALMVGDQYLTDVAAANRAGMRSAKVPTFQSSSFPRVLQWGQRAERALFLLLHGRPLSPQARD